MTGRALLLFPDPPPTASGPVSGATAPTLPGLPPTPVGAPGWLTWVGWVVALLALLGAGAVLTKLVEGWLTRRKVAADADRADAERDEILTKVAVTLVEPLRDRLDRTELRLTDAIAAHEREREVWQARAERERAEFSRQVDELRAKVRDALAEADGAVGEAHRLRRLVQQWHRAIMDPAATMEWLRQLVGPDEPVI